MINDRLDTLVGLQPPVLSPPNNTNFEFDVVTLPHFQIDGKVLTSRDRLKSESDLENESDLGEGEPGYRDAGKT